MVKIGVESTRNTRFFKHEVEKAGAEVTVINTLKFKVIHESAKKTDKHDASTISEFLSKDMLPESSLCSKETDNIRRLLKSRERLVRSIVGQKNRYIIATSLSLSNNEKQKIVSACEAIHLKEEDIYGNDDLNAILMKHPNILKNYYKLWAENTATLEVFRNYKIKNFYQ